MSLAHGPLRMPSSGPFVHQKPKAHLNGLRKRLKSAARPAHSQGGSLFAVGDIPLPAEDKTRTRAVQHLGKMRTAHLFTNRQGRAVGALPLPTAAANRSVRHGRKRDAACL